MQKSLVIFPERAIISFAKYRKNIMFLQGALAQLGARNIRIVEARGSNPLCSTYEVARRTPEATVIVVRFGIVLACKLQI